MADETKNEHLPKPFSRSYENRSNDHHHHCDNDDDDGHDDVVINVLHLLTADVAALDDDQDDESNDVSEYDVEIRAGLSTGTRHFSPYLLYLT